MTGRMTNWAGNVRYGARRLHRPGSVAQLQQLVADAERVRAVGSGHSFNRFVDSPGDLVSLADLPPVMDIDSERHAVTVAAGVRYGELAQRLHLAGYALANLASLPHISVGGAVATGTHGSGDHVGSMAGAVSAVEQIGPDGQLVTVTRDSDRFDGYVVGLGALGIVTRLTLDLVPPFEIRQYVYDDLPLTQLDRHFADILGSAYSVSLFTDWTGPRIHQLWRKVRVDQPNPWRPVPDWLDATPADGPRHPIAGLPASSCTEQLGRPGPWHLRLPHFRPGYTPSSGAELQSEYLLPREHAVEALAALDRIRDRIAPVLQICEIRTVAADRLWLSPSHGRDSAAFHFTWVPDGPAVARVLAAIEEALAPFGARPHWGKVFGTPPGVVAELYPRYDDFRALRRDLDPSGKFGNHLLDRYFPRG